MSDIDLINKALAEDKARGVVTEQSGAQPPASPATAESPIAEGAPNGEVPAEVKLDNPFDKIRNLDAKQVYKMADEKVTSDVLSDVMDILEKVLTTILLAPYRVISIFAEGYRSSGKQSQVENLAIVICLIAMILFLFCYLVLSLNSMLAYAIGAVVLLLSFAVLKIKRLGAKK